MVDTGDNAAQLKAHEQTWSGFKTMMLWGTIGAAAVAALVVFLISAK